MKYKLPILALAIVLAALWTVWRWWQPAARDVGNDVVPTTATTATIGRTVAGADVLRQTVQMIESFDSLQCRVRHRVRLYRNELRGSGEYVQGASGRHQFRLELNIHAGAETARLIEVCDGRSIWTYRQNHDEPSLSHVDLRRVQADLESAAAPLSRYPWRDMGGIGGLPRLLRGLDETFQFGEAEPGTLDQSPVWVVRGRWRAEPLKRLLPGQAAVIDEDGDVDWSQLSPHAPDHVVVIVGRDDRLPYRIEYRRGNGDMATVLEAASSPGAASELLVVMEFFRIRINDAVDPRLFQYSPDNLPPHEHTERYTQVLRESSGRRSSIGPAIPASAEN